MDFGKIKLIIWDLDETFWSGVLSDGTININPTHVHLIHNLTDAGVINSICSKNEYTQVQQTLSELDLWSFFVFNSINWSPKGDRVKQIVDEMNLRYANVLFIDDNHLNLQEAKASCPNIMAESPAIIPDLIAFFEKCEKKDLQHARLEQYKVLEKKKEFKANIGSNEEFLFGCNIQVTIKYDCSNHLERILDLIQRSNQLNFTKVRSDKPELLALLENPSIKCGYVETWDKFGEYGIVGFFAVENNHLKHFVFSCRTLNMGVEQYVYNHLGRPEISIVGEVASSLEGETPAWINHTKNVTRVAKQTIQGTKLLIKGPCDLELVFSFIEDSKNIIKEFVFVNKKGVLIESGNHTTHIVQSLSLDQKTKDQLVEMLPFGDTSMFSTAMFDEEIGAIYLSTFTDPNLGLYREKSSGAVVAFGEWTNDLTNEQFWGKFIKKELFVANCDFTLDSLQFIKKHFEFIGRISPEEIVRNLEIIHSHLTPNTKLILNLGSEIPYENNSQPAYEERHIYHKHLNTLIKEWANGKNNVFMIEVSKFISSQSDYTNNINHFCKPIYQLLAQEMCHILNNNTFKVRKRQKMQLHKKINYFVGKAKETLVRKFSKRHIK